MSEKPEGYWFVCGSWARSGKRELSNFVTRRHPIRVLMESRVSDKNRPTDEKADLVIVWYQELTLKEYEIWMGEAVRLKKTADKTAELDEVEVILKEVGEATARSVRRAP